MQTKQLKQIEFNITHGAPESRLRFAEEAIPVLRQDLNRLRDKAAGQGEEFTEMFEAWGSRPVKGLLRPTAIERDLRDARLVKLVAWVLTGAELALSFFMALVFLVNPFFVLMLALLAIFSLKAGLWTIWRNDAQPQLTRRKLRRWVIAPSLVVTLLAVVMLIFTRGVLGWLALLLLPFINWMLCVLSLGVLGLAAGLFSLGYLYSWSRHAERRFNAIEREAVETRRVLQKAEKVAEELRAVSRGSSNSQTLRGPSSSSTSSLSSPSSSSSSSSGALVGLRGRETWSPARVSEERESVNHIGRFLPSIALTFALLGSITSAGCNLTGAPVAATSEAKSADAAQMEIWLDWSLSAETQAYRETINSLVAALPELTGRYRITRITAHQFGDKGWNAPEILSLDLPRPQSSGLGELGEVGAIYKGVANEHSRQANQQFQAQLREKLSAITTEKLLPEQTIEPPCTDLQGVLARIAENSRSHRRLVFLVTDGHDTCSRKLQPVSLTATALIVIILPEEQQTSASQRPDELWKFRREELAQAAPGAVIIPYFGDLTAAAGEAMAKLPNQSNH